MQQVARTDHRRRTRGPVVPVLVAALVATGVVSAAAVSAAADGPTPTTSGWTTTVDGVELGPASKWVLDDDGTVRQVR